MLYTVFLYLQLIKLVHYHELHQSMSCRCPKCTRKRRAAAITAGVLGLGFVTFLLYFSSNLQFHRLSDYVLSYPLLFVLAGIGLAASISYRVIRKYQRRKAYMKYLNESIDSRKDMPSTESKVWKCGCGAEFRKHEAYVSHHYWCHI